MSDILDKNMVIVSSAVIFDNKGDKPKWFICKPESGGGWEFPNIVSRKTESSVRASIRMMGEKGGMSTKVIEEVGRAGGVTTVNGKTKPQRHIYYLHRLRSKSGEPVGFFESGWFEYGGAVKKLSSKRERTMLNDAREEYKNWKKRVQKRRAEKAKAIEESRQQLS